MAQYIDRGRGGVVDCISVRRSIVLIDITAVIRQGV